MADKHFSRRRRLVVRPNLQESDEKSASDERIEIVGDRRQGGEYECHEQRWLDDAPAAARIGQVAPQIRRANDAEKDHRAQDALFALRQRQIALAHGYHVADAARFHVHGVQNHARHEYGEVVECAEALVGFGKGRFFLCD